MAHIRGHGVTGHRASRGLVVLLLTSTGIPIAAQAPTPSPVGVWDLVELVDWSADGERSEPFGPDPNGIFVYTPGGTLILHITTDPLLPPQDLPASVEDLALRARSSIAYFGRYSVDREAGLVVHHVEGALLPNRVGVSAERPYSLEGDELVLDFTVDDGRRFVRRLRRMEALGTARPRPEAADQPPRIMTIPDGSVPVTPPLADILDGPILTPYTVPPRPLNLDEIERATEREHPAELRDAGTGGLTRIWLLLDDTGRVLSRRIHESSGIAELDAAALRVAQVPRFSPARQREYPVHVWISIPIRFGGG